MEYECYVKISQADWEGHYRYAYMKCVSYQLGLKYAVDFVLRLQNVKFLSFQPN